MSRITRKMLLLGLVGGLLPLAIASMVHAGATGCTYCGVAVFDFNGDGKSDGTWEKPTTSVLVRVTAMDNLSAPINTTFPFATTGTPLEVNGAGHVNGVPDNVAWLIAQVASGQNAGLIRSVKINPSTLLAEGSAFPLLAPAEYSLAGVGDADGNGTSDFYFVKTSGPNTGLVRIFLIGNDGELLQAGAGQNFAGFLPNLNFEALAVGDMTGDGIADLLAWNSSTRLYGVMRIGSTGCSSPTTVCSQGFTFPGTADAAYDFVGIAYNNVDDRMDILSVQTDGNPNPGLIRVDLMGEGASSLDTPVFPITVPAAFEVNGWGNYDGLNQADFMALNATTGVQRVWNLTAAGDDAEATGFPISNLQFPNGFTAPWGSATRPVIVSP